MEKYNNLTQEKLKSILIYYPETGIFRWVDSLKIAGCKANNNIKYKRIDYNMRKLAFLYMTGSIPNTRIYDLGGKNKWKDLTTNKDKYKHIQKNNKTGVTGTTWSTYHKAYKAQITVNRKWIYLGLWDRLIDAARARFDAEIELGLHDKGNYNSSAKKYIQQYEKRHKEK